MVVKYSISGVNNTNVNMLTVLLVWRPLLQSHWST